jgi:predicted nucleic acid-binding Zn ribbon protein
MGSCIVCGAPQRWGINPGAKTCGQALCREICRRLKADRKLARERTHRFAGKKMTNCSCAHCGGTIPKTRYIHAKFCSDKCSHRAQHLKWYAKNREKCVNRMRAYAAQQRAIVKAVKELGLI